MLFDGIAKTRVPRSALEPVEGLADLTGARSFSAEEDGTRTGSHTLIQLGRSHERPMQAPWVVSVTAVIPPKAFFLIVLEWSLTPGATLSTL
jgi:hypothetical protein